MMARVETVVGAVAEVWHRATATQPAPSGRLLAAAALVAALAVLVPSVWAVSRHGVTLVHEAAHAGVAMLAGRRLTGVRLHSDTSGLTVSRGRPHGPGMVATVLAGYVGPGLAGLGTAVVIASGHPVGALWLVLVLLVGMLLVVRNLFGLWTVLVCGAGLAAVTWWATPSAASVVACALALFWTCGAMRAVLELPAARRRSGGSDADQLARLTRVPAGVWVGLFLAVDAAALVGGASVLGMLPG